MWGPQAVVGREEIIIFTAYAVLIVFRPTEDVYMGIDVYLLWQTCICIDCCMCKRLIEDEKAL